MFRYSSGIFDTLEEYLSQRNIPYRAYRRFGMLRFSAALDQGTELYEFRVNVSTRGFWVDVPVPVEIPQKEKITTRLAKFCCRVNLCDRSGGFLVPDSEQEKLVYRLCVSCSGEMGREAGEALTVPPRMVRHYLIVVERLVQGKLSVEEALRVLDKDWRYEYPARLTAPAPKAPEDPALEQQLRRLQEAVEAYFRSLEQQNETT